jgi:quinol monooxygenase YgiN
VLKAAVLVATLITSFTLAPLEAQAPVPAAAPGPRFAVTYVEVLPSARNTLTTAVKAYRDASRREQGYERIELFEQPGRPSHFVIVESWRDPEAFAAHAAAPGVKQFRDAVDKIRLSGYDERPYRALSVAAPAATPSAQAIHVVSHVDIGGGQQSNAPALLTELAETSRKEPGCIRVDVLQHAMRANHFTVVETWASQAALDAHAAAPHTKRYRDVLQPISGSPLDERVVRAVE